MSKSRDRGLRRHRGQVACSQGYREHIFHYVSKRTHSVLRHDRSRATGGTARAPRTARRQLATRCRARADARYVYLRCPSCRRLAGMGRDWQSLAGMGRDWEGLGGIEGGVCVLHRKYTSSLSFENVLSLSSLPPPHFLSLARSLARSQYLCLSSRSL